MHGVLHINAENAEQNQLFKNLPPRKDFYKVVVAAGENSQLTGDILVDIVNLADPNYPTNISTDLNSSLDLNLSQIEFDYAGRIGQNIEIKLTILTDELLLLPADQSNIRMAINDLEY